MISRSSVRFSSPRLMAAASALAIISASPSLAQVTFAQFDQTNVSIQQWTLSEATVGGITTTTIAASGSVQFRFSGVPGVPFAGAEPATFTLNATSTQAGQCNTSTCAISDAFDQAGYSGTFSFIDAGSDPGANLLSGTFTTTANPSQTGATFRSQTGANGGTFTASTDATNVAQVAFTSAFLSFAGETSETAAWSLSSLKDLLVENGFATTPTTNSQAYPSQTFGAAGDGTFSTAVAPVAAGSIQVVKNTVGGNGTFAFTSNFGLSSLTTIGGTANQTFTGLTAGSSYSVSETVPSGWTQTSAVCTNGTPAAITVVNGATTICTFTNTMVAAPPPTGSIQVVKNTVGGNGTFAFTSNFGLSSLTTIGGTTSQTFSGLTAGGSYSVSETALPGWTQTSAVCTNGTPAAITVVNGATTICTFTNTMAAPPPTGSIEVVKNTVGGNGTFAFTSNFGLTSLTTSGGSASQTFTSLTPGGSYSVSESELSGWTQTSAVCTNGTPAAITVVSGATTVCTFTNTQTSTPIPDLTISKSHVGNFSQGDTGDTYTLTVGNAGPGATSGPVTVTDTLPAGLTATAIGGTGWNCTLTALACTRADALAAGASYPVVTVTVNVADSGLAFTQPAGSPAFQMGDILLSMADGTVQWRRSDWTLVSVLPSATDGEAKGMAFDTSGNLYVTHWYGAGNSSGNDVATFNRNGNAAGLFGSGYNCNPASIVFDNGGTAYVGQADCTTQILKFDASGQPLAQYSVAVENRGTYDIGLGSDQCTMYYTSEGPDVKRFNVCTNTQMPNFNSAPLPDTVDGAFAFTFLPAGGMLLADYSAIVSLDTSGNLVRTYNSPGSHCWLGMALDADGTSFWASDWCLSSVTRFDIATGNVIESHVADSQGFMLKKILIPGNIFGTTVTNVATVAGGGEVNTANDSASDVTIINPPAQPAPASNPAGTVNAASYVPTVAAGSIASVFGSNLSVGQAFASTMPLPTTLASSSFRIGGHDAPLFAALPSQVNLQVPWEVAGQTQAAVTATAGGMSSSPQMVNIASFAPGIFTLSQAGSSQGAVVISGTQLIAAPASANGRPAAAGESISIYCTGLGAVSNQPATGAAAPDGLLSVTTTMPTVTIGGIAAPVSFSGLAPGAVGLYQVNVRVPAGASGAAVPLILSIGGVMSNTVTIALQ